MNGKWPGWSAPAPEPVKRCTTGAAWGAGAAAATPVNAIDTRRVRTVSHRIRMPFMARDLPAPADRTVDQRVGRFAVASQALQH